MKLKTLAVLAVAGWAAAAFGQIHGGVRLPDGKQVGMGQVTDDPRKVIAERKRSFKAAIELAEDRFEKKEWGMARETADTAKTLITDQSDLQRVVDLLMKLQKVGQDQLKEAEALRAAGKYRDYLRQLRRLAYQFGTLPCAKQARDVLKTAEEDPELRAGLQEVKAAEIMEMVDKMIAGHFQGLSRAAKAKKPAPAAKDPKPVKTPAVAKEPDPGSDDDSSPAEESVAHRRVELIKQMPLEKQRTVLELMERVEKLYPESPTGILVRTDMEALRSDKAFMTRMNVADAAREAKRALAKAQAYDKGGLRAKAIELYKQVVKKFPDTPEAQKAAESMRELELQASQ